MPGSQSELFQRDYAFKDVFMVATRAPRPHTYLSGFGQEEPRLDRIDDYFLMIAMNSNMVNTRKGVKKILVKQT